MSRKRTFALAAGVAAVIGLVVMKYTGQTDALLKDVPLRLVSVFVLLLGLGGMWYMIRLTPDGHQRERNSVLLFPRLLATLPYGPYRWVMGLLSMGIAGLGLWGVIFGG